MEIFAPGKSFSGVFNTFVNQWCVKKDQSVFKFAFIFHAFPEIPEVLENHAHEIFNFQH